MVSFTLQAPPFSLNKAYYKRSFTRTADCRAWGDAILVQLQDDAIQAEFEALRASFETGHSLHVNLVFFIPQSKFYTKKGDLSRRAQDLSNVEKLLIDLIFDPRFEGRFVDGQEISNLSMDDKYITLLVSEKVPTEHEHRIKVDINLRTHQDLHQ